MRRTVDDILGKLPVAGAVHRMSKAREPALVSRLLEPFVVFELSLERLVEWGPVPVRRSAWRATAGEQPIR